MTTALATRLSDEADQCRNDGADDIARLLDEARAALEAQPAEPLFLLHCGQIDSDGEQDEWETEADSGARVAEFCRSHPGQTVGLYAHAPQPAEPVAVPREWRTALRRLAFMARTSGGTAGEDSALKRACEDAEALLSQPYKPMPHDCGEAGHDEGRCGNLSCTRAAAPSPAPRQALTEWTNINDGVPEKGTDCLVVSQEPWEKAPSVKLDRWDEIHEAPLSFSSATVYVGDGWVEDHCGVTHWMPLPAAPAGIGQGGE